MLNSTLQPTVRPDESGFKIVEKVDDQSGENDYGCQPRPDYPHLRSDVFLSIFKGREAVVDPVQAVIESVQAFDEEVPPGCWYV